MFFGKIKFVVNKRTNVAAFCEGLSLDDKNRFQIRKTGFGKIFKKCKLLLLSF